MADDHATPIPRPDTIWSLRTALYRSYALLAAVQLDLFTPLSDGPMSAEKVGEALRVGPDKLRPLLYLLVEAGLLTVEGVLFSNTPEADHFLVQGRSSYLGAGYEAFSEQWSAVRLTAESIRTGSAQAKVDYDAMSQDELQAHYHSFYMGTLTTGRRLLEQYDFSSRHRLIDVGGGTGGVAIAIAEACPNLRATVADLPTVTPITERFILEAGMADRVQVVPVDVVNESLVGSYDVAVMGAFIPVLSSDHAQRALANVSNVIEPGGIVYVNDGGTLDDSHLSPPEVVRQNLWFINVFNEGQARTESERRAWLTEAGFARIERVTFPDGRSIMTGHKPG